MDRKAQLKRVTTYDGLIGIIRAFAEEGHGYREFSFAHIVLDDYNLSDSSIIYCIEYFATSDFIEGKLKDIRARHKDDAFNGSAAIMQFMADQVAVWEFLRALMDVPVEIREESEDDEPTL